MKPVAPLSSAEAPARLNGTLLLMLAGLAALGSLAANIILPTFPEMASELGTSVKDLSATLASFFVAFAVGQLFVGPLSDHFGRKWLVVGGLATFVVGSAVCAGSNDLPQLIVGRITQALGVCATSVLSRAIARDLFQGEALARALALIMVAMAAAPGFSPLIGGAWGTLLGWRSTFWLLAALAVALAALYLSRLGETHLAHHSKPALGPSDHVGAPHRMPAPTHLSHHIPAPPWCTAQHRCTPSCIALSQIGIWRSINVRLQLSIS